eukprot:c20584_g1_i1 orf=556-2388(+)
MAATGLVLSRAKQGFKSAAPLRELQLVKASEKLIQIFLVIGGTQGRPPVSIEVLRCDAIASVKMRMHLQKKFYVNQQKLAYGRQELTEDERLLKNYGVSNGEMHIQLGVSDLVAIIINSVNSGKHVFKVRRNGTVIDPKKCILQREDGLPLGSHGNILEELSLGGDSVLHLLVQKPAKLRTRRLYRNLEILVTACEPLRSDALAPCTESLPFKVARDCRFVTKDEAANFDNFLFETPQKFKENHRRRVGTREEIFRNYSSVELARHYPIFEISEILRDLLERVRTGLQANRAPVLSSDGSGGVYFMKDECGLENVAVFKPMDEEPLAVNNPRGFSSSSCREGLKSGTRVGEGAIREVAAYLLDHPASRLTHWNGKNKEGFAGVPPTMMVRCYHEAFHCSSQDQKLYRNAKIGSLQKFVQAVSSCEDVGTSSFPVEEVHKITVLDLRLANTDRNGGNILVCKGENQSVKLIPIDHGYCLPEKFEECTFEWLYWPQACHPYGPSALKYIESLDAEDDITLLRQYGCNLCPQSTRVLRVSTMVLKKGAAAGLSPFQIGSIMSREFPDQKSPIENLLEEAEVKQQQSASSEGDFLKVFSGLVDQYIAIMKPFVK